MKNITKVFGGSIAVENVSLTVNEGDFCMLVGTSGSGKSTTLRMINRLIQPTSGEIFMNNKNIMSIPVEQLRRSIGYAIQGIGLFPHRTVAQNIATVPQLLKWSKPDIENRVGELLELLHLDYDAFVDKYPHELSGGQQQRVGVARALAAKPEILLMDEPFGALDPLTRDHLQNEMLYIQQKLNITLVMVTHDIEEAIKLGNTIAVMDEGKLLQVADADTLMRHPQQGFVKSLVGGDDRALRLLSLAQVKEVMADDTPHHRCVEGISVMDTDNLRNALCHLLCAGQNTVCVKNHKQQIVGTLHMDAIIKKSCTI